MPVTIPQSAINPKPQVTKALKKMASGDFGALKLSGPRSSIPTRSQMRQPLSQDTAQFSRQIIPGNPTQPISSNGYDKLEKDVQTSFLTQIYNEKTTPEQKAELNKAYNRAMSGIRQGKSNPATVYGQQ